MEKCGVNDAISCKTENSISKVDVATFPVEENASLATDTTVFSAEPAGSARKGSTSKFPRRGLTFFLCILFSISLLCTMALCVLQSTCSRAYAEEIIPQLNLYQFFQQVPDSERMIDQLAKLVEKKYVEPRDTVIMALRRLMKSQETKDFLADKVGDYIDDLRTGSGSGKITAANIVDLLRSHQFSLCAAFERSISPRDFMDLENSLDPAVLERFSLSRLRDANKPLFDAFKILLSPILLIAVCGLTLGLLVLILFINIHHLACALSAIGITSLVASIPLFTCSYGFDLFSNVIKNQVPQTVFELFGMILDKPLGLIQIFGGCCAGAGLLLLVLGIAIGIKNAHQKKTPVQPNPQ